MTHYLSSDFTIDTNTRSVTHKTLGRNFRGSAVPKWAMRRITITVVRGLQTFLSAIAMI